jgi:hypothetical protein
MMQRPRAFVLPLMLVFLALSATAGGESDGVADIGNRMELFVDKHRIESLNGVELELHEPQRMETVIRFDDRWDGKYSGYYTVFEDDGLFRMYYRGWSGFEDGAQVACYAESKDGVHWVKPNLGLVEYEGSTKNNIVLKCPQDMGTHNFSPFKDTKPGVPAEEKYKALGGRPVRAFVSGDAIHWRRLVEEPVLTKGAFDSQNLAFWDANRGKYAAYFRVFREGVRAVSTATSEDFVHWSEPTPIDLGDTPPEHLYTNATLPYFRAPHYYFSLPKRFMPTRMRLPDHGDPGVSEGVFLSSRDGLHFDRTFMEAFIRPGRDRSNWGDRCSLPTWGILQTAPDEMSIYFGQHYGYPTNHIRRGVLRLDGIASASAGYAGGELVTRPIRFRGKKLVLNYATAGSGSIQVEIQDVEGKALPGFSMEDATELYGDEIAEVYKWKSGSDVSGLSGKPVRLRFLLKDADLYSYRFAE